MYQFGMANSQNISIFNGTFCIDNGNVTCFLCNETTGNFSCDNASDSASSSASVIPPPPYSLWLTILLGIFAAIVVIVTVSGNILVLLSFALERSIRQPTNYFIASLAVSDLLIGTFSMPCFTLYLLLGYWPLGDIICDLWLSLDWTVCLASQYTVFFITVDRFFSVKIPAKYRNWRSERKVVVMVASTWIIPTLIFFTSIIGWQYFVGERTVDKYECEVQFMSDPLFTFMLTIAYYWITLFVMIGLYTGIYRVALKLQKKSEAKQKKMTNAMELSKEKAKKSNVKKPGGAASKNSKKRIENNNARNMMRGIESTSFTKPPEEDRSSSPAFASDEENSSSQGAGATSKTPLTNMDMDDEDDEQTCFVNSAVQTDTTYRPSLKGMLGVSFNHVSKIALTITGTSNVNSDEETTEEKSEGKEKTVTEEKPPSYNQIYSETYNNKSPKPTDKLLENEILQGCKYIDEDSLKSLTSSENIKLLPETGQNCESSTDEGNSPIWKRRDGKYIAIPIPEESTNTTASAIEETEDEEIKVNNDQKTANATSCPSNGKSHSASAVNKDVKNLRDREHTNNDRKTFGSPLHALVKSMREKQKRRNVSRTKTNSKSENRARKALRTITFILGAYVLCWTPYHIMVFIIGVCGNDCVNGKLYNFTYWLCYLNSPINPLCYALANQQFKKTFLRILKLDCHKT